uniref:Fas-associated factor 1/2-like UAS domain-containing protein n=1 Tax=Echinococcus granulosus TaxID=6210 RepID=A0A068WY17_ECHGR|nr:hypothetical protein EgrG_000085600 [Echinococcus granulosus]
MKTFGNLSKRPLSKKLTRNARKKMKASKVTCSVASHAVGTKSDAIGMHFLSFLHTNPDSRYSRLNLKRVPSVSPVVRLKAKPSQEKSTTQTSTVKPEPEFFVKALTFCLQSLETTSVETFTDTLDTMEESLDSTISSTLVDTPVRPSNDWTVEMPQFFNGPLSAAIEAVKRAPGCAWPPIILMLFGKEPVSNRNFVSRVLCSGVKKVPTRDYHGGDDISVDMTSHCIQEIGMTPTTINGLLIERAIKMVPWSCATSEHRRILAAAFRGTRLEQWLHEWCPHNDYPRLVAIGRKRRGDVVCSEFRGSLERTLRWMELVTQAHFHDYEGDKKGDVDLGASSSESSRSTDEAQKKGRRKIVFYEKQEVKFESFKKEPSKIFEERTKNVIKSFQSTRQGSPVPPYSAGSFQRSSSTSSSSAQPSESNFTYPTEKGCETVPLLDTPLHQQVVDKMHKFWTNFRDNFISGLPILPPFLLTRFSTALIRCLEPNSEKQVKPLLVYLHDDEAAPTAHFVANVLCSQRFTHALYKRGIGIWPVDLTGDVLPPNHHRSHHHHHHRLESADDLSPLKEGDLEDIPQQAHALLHLFRDYPAKQTVSKILSERNLPSLMAIQVQNGKLCVVSTLHYSATTKQSVLWLYRIIAAFDQEINEDNVDLEET